MERRNILFSSDWHVGHANVLKFDNRPFHNLDHMHQVLVNNYNANSDDSTVGYFLGDMGLGNSEALRKVVAQLNGTKVLILGNHDKGHEAMYKIGFDVVLNGATLWIAGERVTMSHCPLLGIPREDTSTYLPPGQCWHKDYKNKPYTTENHGQFHLHGHIHSHPEKPEKSLHILDRQMDVGVVANNYKPVNIKQVESWISKYKGKI